MSKKIQILTYFYAKNPKISFFQRSTAVTIIESPNRPPRPHAPRPVFIDDSIIEEENDGNLDEKSLIGVQITPSRTSPGHCTVRRVKAEAVRKLRTPKMSTMDGKKKWWKFDEK